MALIINNPNTPKDADKAAAIDHKAFADSLIIKTSYNPATNNINPQTFKKATAQLEKELQGPQPYNYDQGITEKLGVPYSAGLKEEIKKAAPKGEYPKIGVIASIGSVHINPIDPGRQPHYWEGQFRHNYNPVNLGAGVIVSPSSTVDLSITEVPKNSFGDNSQYLVARKYVLEAEKNGFKLQAGPGVGLVVTDTGSYKKFAPAVTLSGKEGQPAVTFIAGVSGKITHEKSKFFAIGSLIPGPTTTATLEVGRYF